jgi:predicted GIY-YIG superfamily endonuclease
VKEHNTGKVKSTKGFVPLHLVYKKSFSTEAEARDYERMVKDKRKLKEDTIKKLSIS